MPKFEPAQKTVTLARQGALLKHVQPFSRLRFRNGRVMVWDGEVQPTPISETYQIRIAYRIGVRPRVTVMNPKLEKRGNESIPHTFGKDELCLFRFKYYEFGNDSWIAKTILPWASLWLYFYEVWQITGVWFGGGEHPDLDQEKERQG